MSVALIRGFLIEYGISLPPLVFQFTFNPTTLSRSRSITLSQGGAPGTNRGYDFTTPAETPRVAQGVELQPETFTMAILLDASDRMAEGNPIAGTMGIEPELDTLRSMVEPKVQGPGGLNTLAALGFGGARAFQRNETASVLLLVWGTHVLPVFLTQVQVEETAHLPTLIPYRANVQLGFTVIEGNNPFYTVEKVRQSIGAGLNAADTVASAVSFSFGGGF
jgi:hypothetical protein